MMPPPGARRPDADGALAVRDLARDEGRRGRRAASQSRAPAVPAAEPRRVRALGARSARSRHRRQRVPAARHAQRRLRQHRRRADVLGDADGRLPARRGAHLDARGRRSQRQPVGIHRQGAAHRVADAARRRHAVGHARRPRARLHVPGRRRLHVPRHAARHADRPAVRQRRQPQRADRSVDQRRARRAARHRLEDDRDRQERSEPGDAARSTSRPARSTSPPRSSRSSTASSTTWSSPIDYTLADTEYGDNAGITILPHVRDFSITGPYKVTGVSDTPSRRKVFICRPTSTADEIPCARKILSSLAGEAYRRTPNNEDVESLMEFYGEARKGHDFEAGHQGGAAGAAGEPEVRVPLREHADAGQGGADLPDQRPRSGVAAVVLHLEHGARRRAGEGGDRQHAAHAGGARQAGPPDARRSARRVAVDALRVAVAAAAGRREDSSRRAAVPRLRQRAGRSRTSARPSCSSTASCARIATSSTC